MLIGRSRFAAERKTRYLFNQNASVLTQANSSCSFLCHVVQLKTFFITFGIFVSLGIIMPTVYLRRTSQCVHFKAASGLWFLDNLDNLNFLYSVNAPMHLIRNTGISASSGNPLKRCRTRAKVLLQPKAKLICTLMWAPPSPPMHDFRMSLY